MLPTSLLADSLNSEEKDKNIAVGQEMEGYRLVISTGSAIFTNGQDIVINVSLINKSTNDVTIPTTYLIYYKVKISEASGNEVPMTDWGKEMFSSSPNHRLIQHLSSGDAYTMPIALKPLFQINKPGEYTITVSRFISKHGDKPSGTWISSAPLKVIIATNP